MDRHCTPTRTEATMTTCVVVQHRGDGRYSLGDAVGSRVWKRAHAAEKLAATLTAEGHWWAPTGYVVRPLDYVRQSLAHVTPAGRIVLHVPCTCPDATLARAADCAYHNPERMTPCET